MHGPANSFAEYAPEPNPETKKKDVVWFALNEDRPLFAFGGIWTEYRGRRGTKSKPIPGPHLVYGFLTTEPNSVVSPIHPKALPVILTAAIPSSLPHRREGPEAAVENIRMVCALRLLCVIEKLIIEVAVVCALHNGLCAGQLQPLVVALAKGRIALT